MVFSNGKLLATHVFQDVPDSPQFNVTGPEEVQAGASAVFRVDMYLPFPSIDLMFDMFGPVNDTGAFSICSVMIVDTGEHYSCLQKDKIPNTLYPASDNPKRHDRSRMNIGKVLNKGNVILRCKDFVAIVQFLYYFTNVSISTLKPKVNNRSVSV